MRYSAVIIARNEERYIKNTIESILNQSIRPHQVVVVDDGSTDATKEILSNMSVTVKEMPYHDRDESIYSNTLAELRNAGFVHIRDDPVDWVYSGDADIILPPRYCETIMRHAQENDACIGAGIIKKDLAELPMEGFCMIKHDWLKSIGMETKWESIYLCMVALAGGRNTLVRNAADCTVVDQRPAGHNVLGPYTRGIYYMQGILSRRMGASPLTLLVYVSRHVKHLQFGTAYAFVKGWIKGKREVSEEIGVMYRIFIREQIRKKINGHHRMLELRGENVIFHPP